MASVTSNLSVELVLRWMKIWGRMAKACKTELDRDPQQLPILLL